MNKMGGKVRKWKKNWKNGEKIGKMGKKIKKNGDP